MEEEYDWCLIDRSDGSQTSYYDPKTKAHPTIIEDLRAVPNQYRRNDIGITRAPDGTQCLIFVTHRGKLRFDPEWCKHLLSKKQTKELRAIAARTMKAVADEPLMAVFLSHE